jgi:hypothetical protein
MVALQVLALTVHLLHSVARIYDRLLGMKYHRYLLLQLGHHQNLAQGQIELFTHRPLVLHCNWNRNLNLMIKITSLKVGFTYRLVSDWWRKYPQFFWRNLQIFQIVSFLCWCLTFEIEEVHCLLEFSGLILIAFCQLRLIFETID